MCTSARPPAEAETLHCFDGTSRLWQALKPQSPCSSFLSLTLLKVLGAALAPDGAGAVDFRRYLRLAPGSGAGQPKHGMKKFVAWVHKQSILQGWYLEGSSSHGLALRFVLLVQDTNGAALWSFLFQDTTSACYWLLFSTSHAHGSRVEVIMPRIQSLLELARAEIVECVSWARSGDSAVQDDAGSSTPSSAKLACTDCFGSV